MSDAGSAPTNVTAHFETHHQAYRDTHSQVMFASQERRCKRGGGYRMQAK